MGKWSSKNPFPFFFFEPPKPHLTTLSHHRPGYSNKTKYDLLITIRHKFYCAHYHNNIVWDSERGREGRSERKRICQYYMYKKY